MATARATRKAPSSPAISGEVIIPGEAELTATAPAVIQPVTRAVSDPYAEAGIEWADDGSEDIAPQFPEIKLIQGVSKMEGAKDHIGQFLHTDTGEFDDMVELTPLHMGYQQAFFGADDLAPLCVAPDGEHPLPGGKLWTMQKVKTRAAGIIPVPTVPPTACALCPFFSFGPENERPACNRSILLMAMRDDDSLARLRISGAALRPFEKEIKTKFVSGGKRIPIFTRLVTFGSESTTKGTNTWEQLTVSSTPLPMDRVIALNNLAKSLKADIRNAEREAANYEQEEVEERGDGRGPQWSDRDQDIDDLPFE